MEEEEEEEAPKAMKGKKMKSAMKKKSEKKSDAKALKDALHTVEKASVHIHIDQLRATLDLLTRHPQRLLVIVRLYELPKAGGTRHVGPLTDVDK